MGLMNWLYVTIGILLFIVTIYFIDDGWAQNLGGVYKNYKDSKLPLSVFIRLLLKGHE